MTRPLVEVETNKEEAEENVDQKFDVDAFIARIGKRLVEQFDDARAATSPSTVGAAMEQPVKKQLEQILPRGIAVGSGFVIDSEGGTSRQTDIVLYEKDICPEFSINNTPETTYYPCEGVIAVGEVKSTLDKGSLEDAFKKIASVKKLKRYQIYHPAPLPTGKRPILTRGYGSVQGDEVLTVTEGDEIPETNQIFGFVVEGNLRVKEETSCEAFGELACATGDDQSLNMVVVLNGGLITWGKLGITQASVPGDKRPAVESVWSAQKANCFRYFEDSESFRALIQWLNGLYHRGKTSDASAFEKYITHSQEPDPSRIKMFVRTVNRYVKLH